MPNKCCVPGCQSNYFTGEGSEGHITIFKFPENESLRMQWIKAIPRKDWQPTKHSYVCIKHFQDNYLDKEEVYVDKSGAQKKWSRKRPRLQQGAVPTVFPNLPSYLSKSSVKQRTDPQDRKEKVLARNENQIDEWLSSDIIKDFPSVVNGFSEKLKTLLGKWNSISCESGVNDDNQLPTLTFYTINIHGIPKIESSVKIQEDMTVQVCVLGNIVHRNDLNWVLPSSLKLSRWSQLENIMIRYTDPEDKQCLSALIHDVNSKLKVIHTKCLDTCLEESIIVKLDFLIEQFRLTFLSMSSDMKQYSNETVIIAFMIYLQSAKCYAALRSNNILTLPHPKFLQRLSSAFDVAPTSQAQNAHYLKLSAERLAEREKYVILQLDEIYVNQSVEYKSGNLLGFSENSVGDQAKTVQAFLISSAYGQFKAVVSLVPVKNVSGTQLSDMTASVLKLLHVCGFKVVVVISDNNRVNRSMFKILTATSDCKYSFVLSPIQDPIFVMYDPVHIIKNIRNNWVNLKDTNKTFCFPAFDESGSVMKAEFSKVRELYKTESNSLIKTAPKLNYKSVYPSNLEKQKVSLVLNVFDEKTQAALVCIESAEGTAYFIDIIRKWWTVMNIKGTLKGLKTRDSFAVPFVSVEDSRIQFLKDFLKWLEKWKELGLKMNCLTEDTFQALYHSTHVIIELILKPLAELHVDYVLTGKFQTDNIEHRFSAYRQLSGGNYNVSVTQIIESEKKIRVKQLLGLRSAKYGNISFDPNVLVNAIDVDVVGLCSETVKSNSGPDLDYILSTDYLLSTEDTLNDPGFIYICGYVAFKETSKSNCALCNSILTCNKDETNEGTMSSDYIKNLDRGGLSVPSELVVNVGRHVFSLMQVLISPDYESVSLLLCSNVNVTHKMILKKLSLAGISSDTDIANVLVDVCFCGKKHDQLIEDMVSRFCNILLNNYAKHKNDMLASVKQGVKKRKLSTLK